jgi:hypothetical protein
MEYDQKRQKSLKKKAKVEYSCFSTSKLATKLK